MNTGIVKRVAAFVSILSLLILFGCAQNNSSGEMNDSMKPMEEKPMMEMQEPDKMDSKGMMDDMKNEGSMDKTTDQEMGGMDKMMK